MLREIAEERMAVAFTPDADPATRRWVIEMIAAGDIEGSRAESVMIAGLFLYACLELAGLYRHLERPEEAERLEHDHCEKLAVVGEHAWDGEWDVRASDAAGAPGGGPTG